jgi:integrase
MPPANTGHFYELADGTWGVQYRVDGKQRRRSGFPHKTAARKWHADNVLNGKRRPGSEDTTLSELVDLYLERHESIRSPRTIRTLRERLVRPLDAYGETRLSELETMPLELAAWRATLPPAFAHKVMGALRQVLGAGVRWRLIDTNPAADAGENPEPPPRAIRAFTLAELDALEAELGATYVPLIPLAAATGLRPSEWAGLERRHVDRARRVVRVEQVLDGHGGIRAGGKTSNSVREVPLTGRALAALDRLPPRLDTPLLFPAAGGGPIDLNNFRRRFWAPAIEASGIATPARIYDLRSTFASNALHAGVTVFELARVMGTSVRMIERHYGALVDGAHAAITDRLDALEAQQVENRDAADEAGDLDG